MIYLSLNQKDIKLISLSKTLFGQFNVSYFQKKYESEFLNNDKLVNIDVTASAIKEALTLAEPKPVQDKNVYFILPQSAFIFTRYEVPPDISSTAIISFAKDKARNELNIDVDNFLFDYIISTQNKAQYVLLYGINTELVSSLQQALKLIDLNLSYIVPDSLCFYQLFDKTLTFEKKEHILFLHYDETQAYGYLYDNAGLSRPDIFSYENPIEDRLKGDIEKLQNDSIKINRLILSGSESDKVRQDFFTKQVGAWTNPLKKILSQFYQDNLKTFIVGTDNKLPILPFDVCFGASMLHQKFGIFNCAKNNQNKKHKIKNVSSSTANPKIRITKRDILIFVFAFICTFGVVFGYNKLSKTKISLPSISSPTATPIPSPTPTAKPIPELDRSKLNIKILNGSGVAGKAGEFKSLLENKKYKEIITGNADKYDFKTTVIEYKDSLKDSISLIKKDVSGIVPKAEYKVLETTSSADLVITIGADFE